MHANLTKARHILKNLWLDEAHAHRAVPPAMAQRLEQRIAASEYRHHGEICIAIEGGLPAQDLWRGTSTRSRAEHLFAALRMWNTHARNGVLIYLLLAERAIEIVADRGLTQHVDTHTWQGIAQRMASSLKRNNFETALTQALEETSALLMQHFALSPENAPENPDEMSNLVVYL